MKNRTILYILPFALLTILGLYKILEHISKSNDAWVKSRKKMYCYETYHGPVNPAIFVENEKYIDSLKKLYRSMENGDKNPVFNFPPLLVPTDTCVYVLGYSKDSTIAKIQFYQVYKKKHLTYVGYVYANTLHTQKRVLQISANKNHSPSNKQ